MMKRFFTVLIGTLLLATPALAQKLVTGRVTNEQGLPLANVQIAVKGTTTGTITRTDGNYSIQAREGQVLQFRLIGTTPEERTVGPANAINVELKAIATSLNAMVVTALGQSAQLRSLGTAQQTVQGAAIAQTQRENFINALAGRVAGVDVTSSSGVPGASTMITIRGISSISSSNQPLFIVDGLPMDNKTLITDVLASDLPTSTNAFSNRGHDFTNRGADLNPDDIESLTVLKGPEASALYGIDAANGAVVIKTKRGKPGQGGFEYSSNFRIETINARPQVQHKYAPTSINGSTLGSFSYFGAPYAAGTTFYDNISGFFRSAVSQKHNLAFSNATMDGNLNYRLGVTSDRQFGVIPNADLNRLNVTGASQAQVTSWLKTDLSVNYSNSDNHQPNRGAGGPLLGLLIWPGTDNAKDYLTPAGTRRRVTALSQSGEIDNPWYSVNRNIDDTKNTRLIMNVGLTVTPFTWADIKTNIGVDGYSQNTNIPRDPQSSAGFSNNGIVDINDEVTRNVSAQTLFNIHSQRLTDDLSISGFVGNFVTDQRANDDASQGLNFLDPNLLTINNALSKITRTTLKQRRLVSAFGSLSLDWKQYLFVNVTGRNDWTSTIPVERNSFFYPSVNASYVFSDAFPSIARFVRGKIRSGYAQVGRDASPYAYRPALIAATTTFGGYRYDFWGPNLKLKPEMAKSYEFGTELSFFDDRLGLDLTYYKKKTQDQIVNDIRESYGTGFILFNLNGATTENHGIEAVLRGTPVTRNNFSWDVLLNWTSSRGKTLSLPNGVPEAYNAYTWLYGNVRNGTMPGLSTNSLTGFFYQRVTANNGHKGELLIDPTTGIPLKTSVFVDAGYDRQPDWTAGLSNTLRFRRWTLDFLIDLRKGGDVFNATEHDLTTRGLSMMTLDRETPRVVKGVIRDGKENSQTPTVNSIVIVPAVQTGYYTGISEELFIQKNINWVRLRDITVRYNVPDGWIPGAKNASLYFTATDPWLKTNYTGLDPIENSNTAAVGGSSAVGIDYGNFPVPRGYSFGLRMGF